MYRAYTSDKRSDPSHLQPFNPLRMLSVLKNISIRVIPQFRHRAVIATHGSSTLHYRVLVLYPHFFSTGTVLSCTFLYASYTLKVLIVHF